MLAATPARGYEHGMATPDHPVSRPLKDAPEVLVLDKVLKRSGKKNVLNGMTLRVRAGEVVTIIGGAAGAKAVLTRVLNGQLGVDRGSVLRAGLAGPTLSSPMGFNMGGTALRGLELRAAAYGIDLDTYVNSVAGLLRNPEELRKPLAAMSPSDRMTILYGSALLLPCTNYTNNSGPLPADKRARAALRPLFREVRKRAGFICLNKRMTTRETFPNQRFLRLHTGRLFTIEEFDAMMEQERSTKAPKPDQKAPEVETT